MIVISGALVLVALVLLIFGITTTDLDFVYASIVVSLVSFVFLLIGILQRRGDKGADASGSAAPTSTGQPADERPPVGDELDEGATAVTPRVRERAPAAGSARVAAPVDEEVVEDDAPADDELLDEAATAGTVLVVPGRPRYHVAGCRYLTGKAATEVEVGDARDEGFSPCGVCKPDDALAIADEPEPEDAEPEDAQTEEIVLEDVPGAQEIEIAEPAEEPEAAEPLAAVAPARRTRATSAPRKAPATRSPRPRKTAAAAAAAAEPAGDSVLEAVASEAPATADGAAADGAAVDGAATATTAAARRRTGTVVVIPDRGKFHRSECRYVRNAEGTSTMSRTQAARQGYDACGVCKP